MNSKTISYRIFIGNAPIENLTSSEREAFADRCILRMGESLNNYFSGNPKEYERMCEVEQGSAVLRVRR